MDDIQSIISMTDSLLSIIILLYALAKMSQALTQRTNDYIATLKEYIVYHRDAAKSEISQTISQTDTRPLPTRPPYPTAD